MTASREIEVIPCDLVRRVGSDDLRKDLGGNLELACTVKCTRPESRSSE